MKLHKLFPFLQNQRGIALLVVMGSVTILTYLIVDFTFETKVNKMRVHNVTDRTQARLTAEAGLNIAMARIKLYQEARNLYEQNENIQNIIDLSVLEESIRNPDFMFPVPVIEGQMNQQAQSAVQDFNLDSLLQGNLHVNIASVSGFLNPNNMRFEPPPPEDEFSDQNDQGRWRDEPDEDEGPSAQEVIEETLIETLREAMERKSEEDDIFDMRYGNLDPVLLIKELKYFVNHPDDFDDPERGEIESLYRLNDVTAKHAPLTSLEELYLLEGWSDAIVDLIKDRLTVHEVSIIQVNELTENQLRVLFPEITDFQIEEFFRYRDGDPERNERPRPFQSQTDFQNLIVERLGVLDQQSFEQLMSSFEAAGLSIGVAGKLFRVTSSATFNRATYTLEAYVDLPIKPQPPAPPRQPGPGQGEDRPRENENDPDQDQFPDDSPAEGRPDPDEAPERPLEFLTPRAVEIRRI